MGSENRFSSQTAKCEKWDSREGKAHSVHQLSFHLTGLKIIHAMKWNFNLEIYILVDLPSLLTLNCGSLSAVSGKNHNQTYYIVNFFLKLVYHLDVERNNFNVTSLAISAFSVWFLAQPAYHLGLLIITLPNLHPHLLDPILEVGDWKYTFNNICKWILLIEFRTHQPKI